MPIDSAAPAYHSSALKIARRIRFLSVCLDEAGSLTLPGFEFFVFDIAHPLNPLPRRKHRFGHAAVTVQPGKSLIFRSNRIKTQKAFEYNAFASPAGSLNRRRALTATIGIEAKDFKLKEF